MLSNGGARRPELRSRVARLETWQSECGADFSEGLSSAAETAYRRGYMDLGFAPRRAQESFSRAYCLSGDPSQLLNLAQSQERLSSYAEARRSYERYLALVPDENLVRLGLVMEMYAGRDFAELQWNDRALSRPQIELMAARTSALNECFY